MYSVYRTGCSTFGRTHLQNKRRERTVFATVRQASRLPPDMPDAPPKEHTVAPPGFKVDSARVVSMRARLSVD